MHLGCDIHVMYALIERGGGCFLVLGLSKVWRFEKERTDAVIELCLEGMQY